MVESFLNHLIVNSKLIIKKKAKKIIAQFYWSSGRFRYIHKNKVCALMYHRILPKEIVDNHLFQPGMYTLSTAFEEQVDFLVSNYKIISMIDFIERYQLDLWDKNVQYCIITFDDGWRDNYDYAFPILKKYNLPATIFLTTNYIDTDCIFWPERLAKLCKSNFCINGFESVDWINKSLNNAGIYCSETSWLVRNLCDYPNANNLNITIAKLKQFPTTKISHFLDGAENIIYLSDQVIDRQILNWDEIQIMSKNNISFGSHGESHSIMTFLSSGKIKDELINSNSILQNAGIAYVPIYCYPNGDCNAIVLHEINQTEYWAAFTTQFGLINFDHTQKFQLKRIAVHSDIGESIKMFALQLSGMLR